MWARQLLLKSVLINWDLKAGTIICDFDELVNEVFSLPMANRSILKISAKIFDPLMDLHHQLQYSSKFYLK